jgi:hypothetical protein
MHDAGYTRRVYPGKMAGGLWKDPEDPSPEDDATVHALKKELGVRRSSIFANTGTKIGASGYTTLRDYIDAVKALERRYP